MLFEFIKENIGTIIVLLVIAAAVAAIVIKLIKNKRKGVSACSCGCENCPMSGNCKKGT